MPRIAIRHEERKDPASPREQTIWHRASADQPWEMIGVARGKEEEDEILPLAFDFDDKTLYVSAHAGHDRRSIFKYDIAARKLGEQLFKHPLIDLDGAYIYGDYSTGRVWGMKHDGTKVISHRELAAPRILITGFTMNTRGQLLILDHAGKGDGG